MDIKKLITKHKIISEQIRRDELLVLLTELKKVIDSDVPGDVVEFGCYEGTSALFFERVISAPASDKKLWLYDSFEGLPEKTAEDASVAGVLFKTGELRASKARLAKNFVKAGLRIPEIKRAWFYELDPGDLPQQISFAFLDGDYYESIMDSLKLVWPKLQEGAAVIIDDYSNHALPGVAKAVDEWLVTHPAHLRTEASLAILRV